MTSALLSIFFFSTWGLGLLTWFILISIRIQNHNQEMEMNKLSIQEQKFKITDSLISQIRGNMGGLPMPRNSKLQDLIKSANSLHPEVNEIDHNDLIIGVRFEGADYPPTVDDDEDEDS